MTDNRGISCQGQDRLLLGKNIYATLCWVSLSIIDAANFPLRNNALQYASALDMSGLLSAQSNNKFTNSLYVKFSFDSKRYGN